MAVRFLAPPGRQSLSGREGTGRAPPAPGRGGQITRDCRAEGLGTRRSLSYHLGCGFVGRGSGAIPRPSCRDGHEGSQGQCVTHPRPRSSAAAHQDFSPAVRRKRVALRGREQMDGFPSAQVPGAALALMNSSRRKKAEPSASDPAVDHLPDTSGTRRVLLNGTGASTGLEVCAPGASRFRPSTGPKMRFPRTKSRPPTIHQFTKHSR